jgi:two-component system cell cycle sensor histidine kinase/response regulator CckA
MNELNEAARTALPMTFATTNHSGGGAAELLRTRLVDLFEASLDLFCIHDLNGRILATSPSVSHALGYSSEELLSMNIQELLPEDVQPLDESYIKTILAAGAGMGRMTVRTRAGERRIWEYRNVLTGGDDVVISGIARDITEQEATFRAMSDSEHHFRTLVEHGPDVIGIIGLDGAICYLSPSVVHALGHDAPECLGQPLEAFVHEDDREMLTAGIRHACAGTTATERVEIRMRSKAGTYRSFEVVFKPLLRARRTAGVLMNARDVTERKLLEQQLEQASRLTSLGRLAATVAHEFNNVLMGMMPFAELLQRGEPGPQLLGHATRHLSNSIQRGKAVTRDILRFTRPAEPRIQPLALAEWWERFMPEAQALLGDHIELTATIETLTVLADADQLSQILSNLVCNARDAMTAGGQLSVHVRAPAPSEVFPFGVVPDPSRFVQIAVQDTGIGMPRELLRHVFEPLFTTKTHGGTGLGLAVAHQVVTRHGGFIFAESKAGDGSTFHLFLPKVEAAVAAAAVEAREVPRMGVRRVMLVEDEPAIAEGLVALLEDELEITVVTTGAEALERVGEIRPDMLILDIGLPDMDGTDVGRLIREEHPRLPIVFATGHGDSRDVAIGPFVRLLYKPFEISELLEVMAALEREAAP